MGALTDREFQSYRRTSPGRKVSETDGGSGYVTQAQEYSLAVVSPDGNTLTASAENLMAQLLFEQQKTNRILSQILIQLGGFWAEDGLSNVA